MARLPRLPETFTYPFDSDRPPGLARLPVHMKLNQGTRAVLRSIEPGQRDLCPHCREPVMYRKWKGASRKVVANVYEDGRWDRVEHWHAACYLEAGEPYGGDGTAAWAR